MKKYLSAAQLWVYSITALLFILIITSCNSHKSNGTAADEIETVQTAKAVTTGPDCMLLSKSNLATWAPKYTNPTNPPANIITVIKFYPTFNSTTGNYDIRARGYNGANAAVGSSILLVAGVACPQSLPPLLTGQSYDVTLASLNILKADGSLVDFFENIILIPQSYMANSYYFLKFQLDIEIGNNRSTYAEPVLPCPPCLNCKPKCTEPIEPQDTLPSGQ